MSDVVPSAAQGFQAEDAEHLPSEYPPAAPSAEGFQAEEGEHSPTEPEEPGATIA
jgi:hypothetical protein